MKRIVALHFLPGSAGNFLSRCINLLDNTYVWSKSEKFPQTLEEKYSILTYKDVIHKDLNKYNWTEFERNINPYYEFSPHWDIEVDGIGVFLTHPRSAEWVKTVSGADDLPVNLYINPNDDLDWCLLNAQYKRSFQTKEWFLMSEELAHDSTIYQIKLRDIFSGYDQFLPEFIKLAKYLDRSVTPDIEIVLKKLYNEWHNTTLRGEELKIQREWALKVLRRLLNIFEKNS